MPSYSRFSVDIPKVSLPTFLFGSPNGPVPNGLAYADAESPKKLSFTFTECRAWAKRFATGLVAAGFQKGDRILISSINNIFYPTVFHGTIMAGGIYTAANAKYVARELAYQLKDSGARFMLVSNENLSVAIEAAASVGMSRSQIFIFNDALLSNPMNAVDDVKSGVRHWKHLIASPEDGERFAWPELSSEEVMHTTAWLAYSSGTTGLPKGIELTHHSLVANAVQTGRMMDLDPRLRTSSQSVHRSRWLCTLPVYHGLALTYFMIVAFDRRIPWYSMKQFELNKFLDNIVQYRITDLHLVPPIMLAMTKSPRIRSGQVDLSHVLTTFSSAAPLGAELSRQYEQLWPNGSMNVKQGFAMGEAACNMMGWDPRRIAPPGSVGEIMPNCAVKLMDDDGIHEVRPGARGEVWFKGPNRMKCYWRNVAATKDTLTADGWLKTGDIAQVDTDGHYYIVDRKKELIKVKGVQVAPAEIEGILLDHPKIMDAAVVGRKVGDDELPLGFIVCKEGAMLTPAEVIRFLTGKVSKNKLLGGGVIFIDTIPRTPAGKILRRQLRDLPEASSGILQAKL